MTPKTHRYIMKVYKIKITSFQKGGIWYTGKVGNEYYAVLVSKLNTTPVFRLAQINEAKTYLTTMAIILDVYPSDCNVIEEFIIRSERPLQHLFI